MEWKEIDCAGDCPEGLYGHSAIISDGKLIIFGGCTKDDLCTKTIFEFDFGIDVGCI